MLSGYIWLCIEVSQPLGTGPAFNVSYKCFYRPFTQITSGLPFGRCTCQVLHPPRACIYGVCLVAVARELFRVCGDGCLCYGESTGIHPTCCSRMVSDRHPVCLSCLCKRTCTAGLFAVACTFPCPCFWAALVRQPPGLRLSWFGCVGHISAFVGSFLLAVVVLVTPARCPPRCWRCIRFEYTLD